LPNVPLSRAPSQERKWRERAAMSVWQAASLVAPPGLKLARRLALPLQVEITFDHRCPYRIYVSITRLGGTCRPGTPFA
jgi:hypothetical protein